MFASGSLLLALQIMLAQDLLTVKVWEEGDKIPTKMEIHPNELSTLKQYERIQIMYNELSLQNGTFNDLPNLKSLSIFFAKLKELPPGCFQKLPKLIDLVLENDRISTIQYGVFNELDGLIKLSLMMNEIYYIDDGAFDGMESLHTIILNRNRITQINKNWFKNCPNLTIVSLKENLISEIPERAFGNLAKNRRPLEIILSNNSIRTIHARAFEGLVYLEVLRLDDNFIKVVPDVLFERFFSVRKLDLSFNNLQAHDEYVFKNVRQLLIVGNPNIDCDFVKEFELQGQNKTIDIKEQCFVPIKY